MLRKIMPLLMPSYEQTVHILDAGNIKSNSDKNKQSDTVNLSHFFEVAKAAGFVVRHMAQVNIRSNSYAGNHIHRRKEFQVATLGNPTFRYRDAEGEIHDINMGQDEKGRLNAIIVPAFLPHVVFNQSDEPVAVFEFYSLRKGDEGYGDYRALTPEESLLPPEFQLAPDSKQLN